MQPLYVVEFDVSAAPGVTVDAVSRLRRHLATWLNSPAGHGPTESELTRSGDTLLPAKPPGREQRQARWMVEEGGDVQALRATSDTAGSNDPDIQFEPVGAIPVMWNSDEWLDAKRR